MIRVANVLLLLIFIVVVVYIVVVVIVVAYFVCCCLCCCSCCLVCVKQHIFYRCPDSMPKSVAIADTKEIGKFIENPQVTRVVFHLTGMGGFYQILHLTSDFIILFIQIEFNWTTNKSCLYIEASYMAENVFLLNN